MSYSSLLVAFALAIPGAMNAPAAPASAPAASSSAPAIDTPEAATLLWAREQFITKGLVKLDPLILLSTGKEIYGRTRDSVTSETLGAFVHGVARLSDVRKCSVDEKGVKTCRIDPLGGVVFLGTPDCEAANKCLIYVRLFGQSNNAAQPISDKLYRVMLEKQPDMWLIDDVKIMPLA